MPSRYSCIGDARRAKFPYPEKAVIQLHICSEFFSDGKLLKGSYLQVQRRSNTVEELITFVHILVGLHVVGEQISIFDVTIALDELALQQKGVGQVFAIIDFLGTGVGSALVEAPLEVFQL